MPARQIFSAIVYVLRTSIQWKALPREFGSASAVHLYFQNWHRAGLFQRLWQAGLAEYDGMHGIAWQRQAADGAMGKAPLATECAGSVFFDAASFSALLRHAPTNWETKKLSGLVRVSIFGTTPSSPEIIATYFW